MPRSDIVGILLAGGLSRRMGGGDKTLRTLGGRPILDHVIARAEPQVSALVLNANGDPARFTSYGLPVASDSVEGFAGPLAGILAGLDWAAAHRPEATHVASFACDAPFFPRDLVDRLSATLTPETPLACAASDGRSHPVFALWPLTLRDDLSRALVEEGLRKVDLWTARHGLATVDFPVRDIDPFFNANRPDDLAEAERLLAMAN
ncbi:molybdenum cofactor guanylyltransferase MobA [Inquilinus sp. CAU 1745]|uniref:molybdenum cofactor guanylyltransferase MobA n=1 Tax=Inquilinus sp. CAU 1745 TaxID=3140369 RepID=UPI00325C1C43